MAASPRERVPSCRSSELRESPRHDGRQDAQVRCITALAQRVREETFEEVALKLDAAAEHHAKADKHPAWDRTRSGDEPCEEHGHVYHSYPGYAAHVVAQMAKVVRALR
jgi:hypothetical protein